MFSKHKPHTGPKIDLDLQTHPSEGTNMSSLVPKIFHTQTKKSQHQKQNLTQFSSLHVGNYIRLLWLSSVVKWNDRSSHHQSSPEGVMDGERARCGRRTNKQLRDVGNGMRLTERTRKQLWHHLLKKLQIYNIGITTTIPYTTRQS